MDKVFNAFNAFKTYKGQTGFDKDYIDRRVVKVVKKTGPNEHDYIIVDKIIESKRPIKDVVNADKDSCGVYSIIKTLLREQGQVAVDNYINRPVDIKEDIVDVSDVPDNLMGVIDKVRDIKDIYNTLPKEITKGKDVVDFFKDFKQSDLTEYYAKIAKDIISKDKNLAKKKQEEVKKVENKETK